MFQIQRILHFENSIKFQFIWYIIFAPVCVFLPVLYETMMIREDLALVSVCSAIT